METKYGQFKGGLATAFVDPDGYKKFVIEKEQAFRTELAKQRSASK
jgi:metallo-beta-lactamase class B